MMTSVLVPSDKSKKSPSACKLKLAILGDKHVGKTSLLTRYIRGMFNPTYIHTAGGDISEKSVHINGVSVHLTLIDSAGHKYVRSLIKSLYRNVHGIMIVYDVTREHTFDSLTDWLRQINMVNTNNPFIMLVGNKRDLSTYSKVPVARAMGFAQQHGLTMMEVSAKTGVNVMEAFNCLVCGTFKEKLPGGYMIDSIKLSDADRKKNKESKGCCSRS